MSNENPAPLEQRLKEYLQAPGYEAQDSSAIARGMELDSRERPALRELIKTWHEEGTLMRLSKGRYILKAAAETPLEGRIRKVKNTLIFIPNAAGQNVLRAMMNGRAEQNIELPISKHRDAGAMDGDKVRCTVRRTVPMHLRRTRGRKSRPDTSMLQYEAAVDAILERRSGTWVGIYRPFAKYGSMIGDGKTSPEFVKLMEPPPANLLAGMVIAVQALSYPVGTMQATGRIDSVLGWPEDDGVDITTVMRRYDLAADFPEAVLAESAALPEEIPAEEIDSRLDCRDDLVFTIDPSTARDYDDAICVRTLENGWELDVHIADVSYYVRPNTALDAEAQKRGNSTYLPDRVLPMLPPKLCDELCSLKEGVDRLTRLCRMRINRKGEVFHASFYNAVIRSCKRMDYGTALAVLEKRGTCGHTAVDAALSTAHALATVLRARRMKQGALDLEVPELRLLLDEHGRVTGVETERSDIAHQLIEEFMLAANETVAAGLTKMLTPTVYRIHEEPDPNKLQTFASMARSYGIKAGTLISREELSQVSAQVKAHPDSAILTTALLKAMMRARYSTRALGHFGLAKGDYCHFTSPIRRYADLIVHRGFDKLVHGKNAKVKLPSISQLDALTDHLSETERNSAAAENEAKLTKLTQYLMQQCESEFPHPWRAIITDCYRQGMAIEVPELQLRGYIPGEYLDEALGGSWFYEPHAHRWSSTDTRFFLPGDSLQVFPTEVDMTARFAYFYPLNQE